MDKDISEIAKLTERISKDPKSKLFVPLAEEYKKGGDIEMAIFVLTEGLKNNPEYITARSFLGKLLFESGDLLGAQKELEEVVKAIPDNLMAQRKLGDVNVLLDRPAHALVHYKAVMTLNPKDLETASLISDLEAGRDIKARIPKSKYRAMETPKKQESPQRVSPQPPAKPEPFPVRTERVSPVTPSIRTEQPAPVPTPSKTEQGRPGIASVPIEQPPPVTPPVTIPQAESLTPPAPKKAVEEPEEVVAIEPLEAVEPAGPVDIEDQSVAVKSDAPGEAIVAGELPVVEEENGNALFDPSERVLFPEEPIQELQENKKGDDFTTDTLAELYISQGFYEKAVEIYERMVIDNPDSQGLKKKLDNIRAMAAEAMPPVSQSDETLPRETPEPDEQVTSAAHTAPPGLAEWSVPTEPVPDIETHIHSPKQPAKQPRRVEAESTPADHLPADIPSQKPLKEPAPTADKEDKKSADSKTTESISGKPSAGRKETIDRLEHWLKNIMKEK